MPNAQLLLRIGLAVSFLYAAVQSFVTPSNWIGFIPPWVEEITASVVSAEQLLVAFSVSEIILALWLLWGRFAVLSGLVSALLVAGVVVTNVAQLDILFRDIPLIFVGLAIAQLARAKTK